LALPARFTRSSCSTLSTPSALGSAASVYAPKLLSAAYRCPASIQPASKGGGITYLKRILALAVATAVVAGGGVARAQSNGSSQSQKPAATKSKQQTTPRANRTAPRDHDCPFSGSGASSDAALDL
jgi:hypothetical protein